MTTFGPLGSGCVANVAAASKASSTVAARVIPPALHAPSKIASLAASAPVWLAAARAPLSVAPPFTTTTGFVRAAVVRRDISPAPSLIPSTYARETFVAESVLYHSMRSATPRAAALPADTARLIPTPVCRE